MTHKNVYTVVVADDEDMLREAVCTMVPWAELGFSLVGSATNGLDALELVEKLEPDLLLTDIRMPFISGIELARQVREIRPAMNIAFLSGYDDFSYAKQAIQYNIISYMLKPLTIDGIAAELRTVHQKMDAQFALFRQASQTQAPPRQDKRAVFLMPLVLDEYAQPDANTGTYAVECGLLQDKTDKPPDRPGGGLHHPGFRLHRGQAGGQVSAECQLFLGGPGDQRAAGQPLGF